MYDWLADALKDSSHLVTASRRLARVLHAEYGQQQLAAGRSAWRTPTILAYPDWVAMLLGRAEQQQGLPTRLNNQQARLLWERSLRREVDNPLLSITLLARQCGDTWARLEQWQVPLEACAASATGKDKRMFVRAARNYESILATERWVDPAGLPALVTRLIADGRVSRPERVRFVGFDRVVPEVASLVDALTAAACDAQVTTMARATARCCLHRYETPAAEMRAAGVWVREQLRVDGQQRIGIVVPGLEQSAARASRLLREGLLPGWQIGGDACRNAVNVSYGRKLAEYPAIATALEALRWLHADLSTLELSQLLRTPALGLDETDGRSRLELQLRQMPDRRWSPAMLVAVFKGRDVGADSRDFLRRAELLAEHRAQLSRRCSPAQWAQHFDAVLTDLNWPGSRSLGSIDYQLVNRWRELLNDLAQLEMIVSALSLSEAWSRLAALAGEAVFQPEAEGAAVELLGPLEAAGIQFDKLWIAGFSTANWPAPARPLALVSRDLQRDNGMPDANPHDTLDYSSRVLQRLLRSAPECVLSYAETDGDAEQIVSSLVAGLGAEEAPGPEDPGWYARQLAGTVTIRAAPSDPVPAVAAGEVVGGGAMTIQRQFSEPFAAFVHGRLGVRALFPIVPGLAPNVRGNLLHDALAALYADCPTRDEIAAWDAAASAARTEKALAAAFAGYERHADDVLRRLLELEKLRAGELLRSVIALDAARPDFRIAGVENSVVATIAGISLQLRYDRVDCDAGGAAIILDYKTGRPRQLLDRGGEPKDMQLVAYSCALAGPVAAIGLVNVDSRGIDLDMAGAGFTPELEWPTVLEAWQEQVHVAATEIARGDIRLSAALNAAQSRPLGLLSRYRELVHDG